MFGSDWNQVEVYLTWQPFGNPLTLFCCCERREKEWRLKSLASYGAKIHVHLIKSRAAQKLLSTFVNFLQRKISNKLRRARLHGKIFGKSRNFCFPRRKPRETSDCKFDFNTLPASSSSLRSNFVPSIVDRLATVGESADERRRWQ